MVADFVVHEVVVLGELYKVGITHRLTPGAVLGYGALYLVGFIGDEAQSLGAARLAILGVRALGPRQQQVAALLRVG
jgi:hypothetical protein